MPPENVLPFPDCSVASLSSVISIPADLKLSVLSSRDEDKTLCDDSFFLKQVKSSLRDQVLNILLRLQITYEKRFFVSWKECVEIHCTVI